MFNKQKFSKRLKTLRQIKGISTRKLATAIGLKSHGAITQFEKGTSLPATDTLIAMAEFFDVSLDYLVGITDTSFSPDYSARTINSDDISSDLSKVLNKINRVEKGKPENLNNTNVSKNNGNFEDLITELDEDSIVELQNFVEYLYIRQRLNSSKRNTS